MKWYNKILRFLFKSYSREVNAYYESIYQVAKDNINIANVVRERLKGIIPSDILEDSNSPIVIFLQSLDDESRLAFLSKADRIKEEEVFTKVMETLIQSSERRAMNEATTMEEVDFCRATIQGIMLFEETIDQLSTLYKDQKVAEKKLSDAERFNPI